MDFSDEAARRTWFSLELRQRGHERCKGSRVRHWQAARVDHDLRGAERIGKA